MNSQRESERVIASRVSLLANVTRTAKEFISRIFKINAFLCFHHQIILPLHLSQVSTSTEVLTENHCKLTIGFGNSMGVVNIHLILTLKTPHRGS